MIDKGTEKTTKESGQDQASNKPKEADAPKMTPLGFLAVSTTRASRMVSFAIMPGFDDSQPKANLQAKLAEGGWTGYAVAMGADRKLRLKGVIKKA